MTQSTRSSLSDLPAANLIRRLTAMLYDAMLLAAVLLIATFIFIPLSGGEAIKYGDPLYPYLQSYLLFVSFLFYGWFWTHGGQTLGMRAWRLRVQNDNGVPLSWTQALLRFMSGFVSLGLFGLGMLWMLVDRKKLTWHDRFSDTRVAMLPKPDKTTRADKT